MKKVIVASLLLSRLSFGSFFVECSNIENSKQKFSFYFMASCHGKNRAKIYQALYDFPNDPTAYSWDQVGDEGLFTILMENTFELNFDKDDASALIDINDNATSTFNSKQFGDLKLTCQKSD